MTENTPLTKAQTAAQDLLARTNDVAERLATDLKTKAEPTADQVSTAVNDLIAWARRNSERIAAELDEFRSGVENRLAPVSVVTKADLASLEARVAEAERTLAEVSKSKAAAPKASAVKSTAKKPATKSTAKKPAAPKRVTKAAPKTSTPDL